VSSAPPERVRRIAVLRANGLGDLVLSLPALDALRARFPDAEIVLLGRAWHADLLSGRPSPVDRVEAIPDGAVPGAPNADRAEADAFLERMRAEAFDLALQLHGGGRESNPFVGGLGARLTVGMRTPDAAPLDRWIPYVYYQHEIARYLDVVGLAGARPVTIEPSLAVTQTDLAGSVRALAPNGRPIAVLHPGATDRRRRWPASSFAAVGDAMHARGLRVVLTGTEAEADVVTEVVAAMRDAPEVARGTDLSALIGVLARAGLVVSNDSGPMHLAAAVGTPTVGIYWCGNLVNGGPLFVDRRRHATSWRLDCPVCGIDCTHGRCEHDASFVADVEVEEVLGAAEDLLERHPPPPDDEDAITRRAAGPSAGPVARRRPGREASSEPPDGRRRRA
jgi:ADP-heptose:LPS heptosyltransferase